MRCPTTHGPHQCEREANHEGECETRAADIPPGVVVTLDLDARRELVKAARRIEILERALQEIRHTNCDPRAVAEAALESRLFRHDAMQIAKAYARKANSR